MIVTAYLSDLDLIASHNMAGVLEAIREELDDKSLEKLSMDKTEHNGYHENV